MRVSRSTGNSRPEVETVVNGFRDRVRTSDFRVHQSASVLDFRMLPPISVTGGGALSKASPIQFPEA